MHKESNIHTLNIDDMHIESNMCTLDTDDVAYRGRIYLY